MAGPGRLWYGREWTGSQELHHIGDYRHAANQRVPARTMTFDEVVLVARGSLHMRIDGRDVQVPGGYVGAVRTGSVKVIDGGQSRGRYLWIGIGDERHRGPPCLAQLDVSERAHLAHRVQALAEAPQPAPSGLLAACDALLDVCRRRASSATRRAAALAVLAQVLETGGAPKDGADALRPALALVEGDPVAAAARSLPDLAALCGLGLTTFKQRWLARTGLSPGDDIVRRRLALAAPRLAAGEPVATVAAALGYASPRAFRAAWKRLHGRTPRGRDQSAAD
jgi:AraC-like DNA-binding protein